MKTTGILLCGFPGAVAFYQYLAMVCPLPPWRIEKLFINCRRRQLIELLHFSIKYYCFKMKVKFCYSRL